MPDAISAVLTVLTVFNTIQYVQQEDVDVFINGNKVAETTPAQIIQEGEQRKQEILLAAQEHQQRILSQTRRRLEDFRDGS
jgi:vacuolar-type H+-ATPase subunit H